jgi:uncharacterized membrane protein YecN with MAPEG domain
MTITALYGGLLGLLYLALTFRVILFRRRRHIDMGDGGERLLERYLRGHGNFAEYVPLGLLLLLVLELGHRHGWFLHLLGLMLLGGRLAHAWAFSVIELRLPSRTAGMVLTTTMLGLAALSCLALGLGLG